MATTRDPRLILRDRLQYVAEDLGAMLHLWQSEGWPEDTLSGDTWPFPHSLEDTLSDVMAAVEQINHDVNGGE